MIPMPKGWLANELGTELVLVPPPGAGDGVLRYLERARPLGTLRDLVEQTLREQPELAIETVGDPELLVTAEGEYASLVTIRGSEQGRALQLDLAFVMADDCYARIASVAYEADAFAARTALVRHLARHDIQLLGVRRRRALYQAPAGWRDLGSGMRDEWVSGAFPEDPASIAVWPAIPHDGPSSRSVGELIARSAAGTAAGGEAPQVRGPAHVRLPNGLEGERWLLTIRLADGTPLLRELLVLADPRYTYVLRLDATADGIDAHRETLRQVAESLRPIPAPRLRAAQPAARVVVDHWLA